MRRGQIIEIDWELTGAQLANEGDTEQAAFIKAFLAECGTWGTRLEVERQLAFVNKLLTDEEKEALKMLSYTGDEQ